MIWIGSPDSRINPLNSHKRTSFVVAIETGGHRRVLKISLGERRKLGEPAQKTQFSNLKKITERKDIQARTLELTSRYFVVLLITSKFQCKWPRTVQSTKWCYRTLSKARIRVLPHLPAALVHHQPASRRHSQPSRRPWLKKIRPGSASGTKSRATDKVGLIYSSILVRLGVGTNIGLKLTKGE